MYKQTQWVHTLHAYLINSEIIRLRLDYSFLIGWSLSWEWYEKCILKDNKCIKFYNYTTIFNVAGGDGFAPAVTSLSGCCCRKLGHISLGFRSLWQVTKQITGSPSLIENGLCCRGMKHLWTFNITVFYATYFNTQKDNPYLAHMGELWGVVCGLFLEEWLTAL